MSSELNNEKILWKDLDAVATSVFSGVIELSKIVSSYQDKIKTNISEQKPVPPFVTYKYIGASNLMNLELESIKKMIPELEEFINSKENEEVLTGPSDDDEIDPNVDYMAEIKEYYDWHMKIAESSKRVFSLMAVIMVHIGHYVDPEAVKSDMIKEYLGILNSIKEEA